MSFYLFNQNNSGGSFVVDKKLCHRLFIEADTMEEAIQKAEKLGVYFDGVENGFDCNCCGDRWYEPDKVNLLTLSKDYNQKLTLVKYAQLLANRYGWTNPDCRIFYKNGKVKEI